MKKKRIPKSINLLGRKIIIKEGSGLVVNGMKCWGYADTSKNLIMLEKDQADHDKYSTLLHELCHHWLALTGIDLCQDPRETEILCQLFALVVQDIQNQL